MLPLGPSAGSRHRDPARLCQASGLLHPPLWEYVEFRLQLLPKFIETGKDSEVLIGSAARASHHPCAW